MEQHDHIKWLLRTKGTSLSEIAKSLGLSPTGVTQVSKGRARSKRVENAIAEATGLKPSQLWPEKYPQHAETN
ncbi:helix-turn-helix domain-containing protein [Croceicoccus mobilis]|uniref:Ner winged helix-turn-helix DNA-binding domain-containing protein n=1 Tax=Croceicoccus mobilis TaxID=1703339 RepID=A0A917DYE6_9SPHN|nr:hypothetical protein GCM10010990_34970 [Croceicoccus mobilis]